MDATGWLFGAEPVVLVEDGQGGIRYWPRCLARAEEDALFEQLREQVAWASERRPMDDRIVDVPRLQAALALADPAVPPGLPRAVAAVEAMAPAAYTHVGLNFYRDGRDGVAMHGDRTAHLVDTTPIAILSLGATRDMLVRAKSAGGRALRIALEPGSLLVMSHAIQRTHVHGIPKTSRNVGPRISCAFRAWKDECDP
jgi:alkylated DNA repair dioxygenase AlkB